MKKLPLLRRPRFAKRILEVGPGHAPFAGITHAVDKFPESNRERAGNLSLPTHVEFREGDLENLPFQSGEGRFDFIYASHVLEHVTEPRKVQDEINRIANAGYVETPSPLREQLTCLYPYHEAQDFHRHFCWTNEREARVFTIRKSAMTVGEFCECENGRLVQALFKWQRGGKENLEPLLPGTAKNSRLHFKGEIRIQEMPGFRDACQKGHCAFSESAREVRKYGSLPWALLSKRFLRLRRILKSIST